MKSKCKSKQCQEGIITCFICKKARTQAIKDKITAQFKQKENGKSCLTCSKKLTGWKQKYCNDKCAGR